MKNHTLSINKNIKSGTPKLSVIIPFSDDTSMPHLRERLLDLTNQICRRDEIEFIVVDASKGDAYVETCRTACESSHLKYLRYQRTDELFSIGFARNMGAQHATGKAVAFFDVDLRVSEDFWGRLLEFIAVAEIGEIKKRYFAVPCLYLTETGTAEYLSASPKSRVLHFLLRWLRADMNSVRLLAPCSSFIVVDRFHYLSIGGHRIEFAGHGYEDFELHHRLMAEENRYERPNNYYHDSGDWRGTTYEGFRAGFSIIGREALFANLLAIHLWHQKPVDSTFYQAKPLNSERLIAAMKAFDQGASHPPPLVASEACGQKFLFLGRPESNSAKTLREVFPILGSPVYTSEWEFFDNCGRFMAADLEDKLIDLGIDKVLFPNPYRNAARRAIYNWCRKTAFPYLVFERGGLPNSWFFDSGGFNADSSSYSRSLWDHALTRKEEDDVREYIKWCLAGHETLEKQGERIGRKELAERLCTKNRRVLFVPLQRPSDTVTVHMAGTTQCFAKFVNFIDEVAMHLAADNWMVLCKRHPYENDSPPLRHAVYVDPATNILDLLELADAVAMMNSGVGLYAMMMGKPNYLLSNAFYAFSGLNESVSSLDALGLCKRVQHGLSIDTQTVHRFLHYLTKEFYSFGTAAYQTWTEADGSSRKAAYSIDFSEIRIPGVGSRFYRADGPGRVPLTAPLFERYRAEAR